MSPSFRPPDREDSTPIFMYPGTNTALRAASGTQFLGAAVGSSGQLTWHPLWFSPLLWACLIGSCLCPCQMLYKRCKDPYSSTFNSHPSYVWCCHVCVWTWDGPVSLTLRQPGRIRAVASRSSVPGCMEKCF